MSFYIWEKRVSDGVKGHLKDRKAWEGVDGGVSGVLVWMNWSDIATFFIPLFALVSCGTGLGAWGLGV